MGSLFSKGITQVLSEACKNETACCNEYDEDLTGILDDLDELEELDCDICYTTEMVNVLEHNTEFGRVFLVEYDNLAKLMESKNIDEKEALSMVCEYNLLSLADTYVLIESHEDIEESINEAKESIKSCKNPVSKAKRRKKISDCGKVFKNLKNKGIKVLKKKSKKR